MDKIINGIQQMGIGVVNAKDVFNWYRTFLGFDILVFEDEAEAALMTRYTDNISYKRIALLALNLKGGGGLEIWQFKDRVPKISKEKLLLGDLGINIMKVRSTKIKENHTIFQKLQLSILGELESIDTLRSHFFCADPWHNLVQLVEHEDQYTNTKSLSGGVMGAVIGVSNMAISIKFYQQLLGYDIVYFDEKGVFKDFENLPGGKNTFHRVILKHSKRAVGGFGELLGSSEIELIQVLNRTPLKTYKDRLWGDVGYIHLCFDIHGITAYKEEAALHNFSFTVDSTDSFDMGDAAGQFGYLEDPDGTLIELVETHKVPIFKKWGIYIDLKKRNPIKPLPKWIIKAMKIHRVKKDL